MDLTPLDSWLLNKIFILHRKLRFYTFKKYKRINPFCEDLFDWHERGKFWSGHDNVTVYNSTTITGNVEIGSKTWIGPFCSLDGTGGLKIGSNCSISAGVQILTHDSVKWALSGGNISYEYSPTQIGDNCFLGTHSIILKGVSIGKCSIVGAGTIVTKSFPDFSIIIGNPGSLVGKVYLSKDGNDVKYIYFKGKK